jgi:hypothetical protein
MIIPSGYAGSLVGEITNEQFITRWYVRLFNAMNYRAGLFGTIHGKLR